MAVIRFGRFIPTTLREWERILEPLNKVIAVDENGSATVTADNLPPQDAQYLTLSNNATLTADRVLTPATGELAGTDAGANGAYTLGLADAGTAGTYTKVTTDAKGRVTAGTTLVEADIPAEIQRVPDELDAASSVALTDTVIVSQSGTTRAATAEQVRDIVFGDDWTDLVVPAVAINPLGSATPPALNNSTGCLEFSASADNTVIFTWQLPHGWSGHYDATKAVVVPHLHVRFLTSTSAPNNVSRWQLEYDVADPFGNFTNAYGSWTAMTTVSVTNPANTAQCGLIDLGDLDLAGYGASCILHCKVSRLAASDGADLDSSVIALYSADLHYQTRTAGSENEIPS